MVGNLKEQDCSSKLMEIGFHYFLLYFLKMYLLLLLVVLGLCCCEGFFLVVVLGVGGWGCSVQASPCGDFSCGHRL